MRIPVTAEPDGRRLRLTLAGRTEAISVDPLPAKCGLALARAYLAHPLRRSGQDLPEVFAEALGGANYARLTGDHVQEFDAGGRYLKTWMPDAVMVEPAQDVTQVPAGQRVRVLPSDCDGLEVRVEEVEAVSLSALLWQSAGGWEALNAYLSGGPDAARTVLQSAGVRTSALRCSPGEPPARLLVGARNDTVGGEHLSSVRPEQSAAGTGDDDSA